MAKPEARADPAEDVEMATSPAKAVVMVPESGDGEKKKKRKRTDDEKAERKKKKEEKRIKKEAMKEAKKGESSDSE